MIQRKGLIDGSRLGEMSQSQNRLCRVTRECTDEQQGWKGDGKRGKKRKAEEQWWGGITGSVGVEGEINQPDSWTVVLETRNRTQSFIR